VQAEGERNSNRYYQGKTARPRDTKLPWEGDHLHVRDQGVLRAWLGSPLDSFLKGAEEGNPTCPLDVALLGEGRPLLLTGEDRARRHFADRTGEKSLSAGRGVDFSR